MKIRLNNKKKKVFYSLFLCAIGVKLFSQSPEVKPIVESFENEKTLMKYQSSDKNGLSVSDEHFVMGKQSLKWVWKNEQSSFGTGYFSDIQYDTKNLACARDFETFVWGIL